jgi:hypothetical protein
MTYNWARELFNQFDLQWNLAHGPSLETLTDEEYLWEPVPGCWSIRPTGPGGRGEFEDARPDPEPAPVTTIAWRLSHLAVGVFGLRASRYFGDLAFSLGIHHCLGAALARLEGRIAVEELTRRYPRLEMAGPPARRPLLLLRGFESVPVRAAARMAGAPGQK